MKKAILGKKLGMTYVSFSNLLKLLKNRILRHGSVFALDSCGNRQNSRVAMVRGGAVITKAHLFPNV